jgi:hypothetical protein
VLCAVRGELRTTRRGRSNPYFPTGRCLKRSPRALFPLLGKLHQLGRLLPQIRLSYRLLHLVTGTRSRWGKRSFSACRRKLREHSLGLLRHAVLAFPWGSILCALQRQQRLTDFIRTGLRPQPAFSATPLASMDILFRAISSPLFRSHGENDAAFALYGCAFPVRGAMSRAAGKGEARVALFAGFSSTRDAPYVARSGRVKNTDRPAPAVAFDRAALYRESRETPRTRWGSPRPAPSSSATACFRFGE